jgi:multidrug resistance efflux pump
LAANEAQLKKAEGYKERGLSNDNDLLSMRKKVEGLKAKVEAEQIKYRKFKESRPEDKVREAEAGLAAAKNRLDAEKYKLDQCTLRAPCDGTILRINVAKGMLITAQSRQAPVLLCPTGPRIVRAEMLPEFAHRVQPGMEATVYDEANAGTSWSGRVKRLADAYLPPRRPQGNETVSIGGSDANLLECIIELTPTATPPRVGQRVRVALGSK